ncbi:MAG: hypothetical protein AAF298_13150 [Cyanobacteria bacterium P01_A01_bin.40]
MEQPWRWCYYKKLRQLESEVNLIREQLILIQESFSLRRSLELSSAKSDKFVFCHQKYIEQIENFHSSLKALSDRQTKQNQYHIALYFQLLKFSFVSSLCVYFSITRYSAY